MSVICPAVNAADPYQCSTTIICRASACGNQKSKKRVALKPGVLRAIRFSCMNGSRANGAGRREERFYSRRAVAQRSARAVFVTPQAAQLETEACARFAVTCAVASPPAFLEGIVRAYICPPGERNKQEEREQGYDQAARIRTRTHTLLLIPEREKRDRAIVG